MADFNAEYHVFKDYNIVFDESKNKFGTLRLVQWVKQGTEPDISKAKLEIRKIVSGSEGEQVAKGYTFSTEEGPHELAESLVDVGFGNTKNILRSLTKREDFMDAVNNLNSAPDEGSEDGGFDMRDLFAAMEAPVVEEE